MRSTLVSKEILLYNYVQPEFQAMLYPLYLMQLLCFSTKYNLLDNFITPKSYPSIIISLLGAIFFSLLHIYKVVIYTNIDAFFYFFTYFDAVFYCFGFFLNFINLITQSSMYVGIILLIINTHKLFPDNNFTKNAMIFNWCHFLPIVFIMILTGNMVWIFKLYFSDVMCTLSLITFDADILHAVSIITLINKQLHLWIFEVENFLDDESYRPSRTCLLEKYFDIMETFRYFKEVFQVTVRTFFIFFPNIQWYNITRSAHISNIEDALFARSFVSLIVSEFNDFNLPLFKIIIHMFDNLKEVNIVHVQTL